MKNRSEIIAAMLGVVAGVVLLSVLGAGTVDPNGHFQGLTLGGHTNVVSDDNVDLTYNGAHYQRSVPILNNLTNGIGTNLTSLLAAAVQAGQTNDGTANWSASGTTNSTLPGAASINSLVSTNGVNTGGLTNTGVTVHTPTAIQSLTAASNVLVNASTMRVAGSGGAVTLTSTPSIQTNNIADGTVITIRGTDDTNTVTLQDYRTLAGTCLAMEVTTVTLKNGSEMRFQWSNGNQRWQSLAFSANSSQNHPFQDVSIGGSITGNTNHSQKVGVFFDPSDIHDSFTLTNNDMALMRFAGASAGIGGVWIGNSRPGDFAIMIGCEEEGYPTDVFRAKHTSAAEYAVRNDGTISLRANASLTPGNLFAITEYLVVSPQSGGVGVTKRSAISNWTPDANVPFEIALPVGLNSYGLVARSTNSDFAYWGYQPSGTLSSTNVDWAHGMQGNDNDWVLWTWNGAVRTDRLRVKNSGEIVSGSTVTATGYVSGVQPGISFTEDVLISGGTTNRHVYVGGIVVSNIVGIYSP